MRITSFLGAGMLSVLMSTAAFAQEQHGPTEKAIGMQPAATDVASQIHEFYYFWLIPIGIAIVGLVAILMLIVIFRFNEKANPEPKKFSHNTMLEVAWTLIPVLILVVIAFKSFPLLYEEDVIPPSDLVVKATGYQWYWEYTYSDPGGDPDKSFTYSSVMLDEDAAKAAGKPRLLGVDNPLVVPAGKTVTVQVQGADVIHSFAVPSFGVKVDAVPGRLNEIWFKADKPGIYYGQCSELCGANHAFMPIEVDVVPQAEYDAWLKKTQADYAQLETRQPVQLASAR